MVDRSDFASIASLVGLATSMRGISEPEQWRVAKSQIKVWSYNYGGTYLEWYPLLSPLNELGQLTVTYALEHPGRGLNGDIGAFAALYNPWGSDIRKGDFSELVLEFTRFAWLPIELITPNFSYKFPQQKYDYNPIISYVTCRIPV